MSTITLKVEGMKCGGCESNVKEAVAACSGVANVSASAKEGTVSVEYNPATSDLETIKRAITDRGFSVQS